jgi:adenylate cyclase
MSELVDQLAAELDQTVRTPWEKREGRIVPDNEQLKLGNDRVEIEAVFLYADLADSTELAIAQQEVASEVCKGYIRGVTKLIKANGGEVRSFDGDRVMGVFIEGANNTAAVRCGLQINSFFRFILIPQFTGFYGAKLAGFTLNQTVGIDRSHVFVCRAGARNDNDLIWVGRAPNIAAKLSNVRNGYNTLISDVVYGPMLNEVTFDCQNGQNLWMPVLVPKMKEYGVQAVYGSDGYWHFGQ